MSMGENITASQYAEQTGKGWGSASKALLRAEIPTPKNAPLTDATKAVIDRVGAGRTKTDKKTSVPKSRTTEAPAPVVSLSPVLNETKTADKEEKINTKGTDKDKNTADKKTSEWWQIMTVCLLVSVLSVSLTTLGLGMFAQWAGYILGGMFALYLLASVLVSRNNQKGDTSEAALDTVLYMELGACVLHLFTFYTLLPDTHIVLRGCAAFIMAGFVAFLSYRAVKFVRLYNAET
jgi:hypothetical protein